MGKGQSMTRHLKSGGSFTVEPLPSTPLVEIWGDHRVLIEGHCGVLEYSRERILVNAKIGTLCVCGKQMEMVKMSRDQLIVQGRINGVSICRRP